MSPSSLKGHHTHEFLSYNTFPLLEVFLQSHQIHTAIPGSPIIAFTKEEMTNKEAFLAISRKGHLFFNVLENSCGSLNKNNPHGLIYLKA